MLLLLIVLCVFFVVATILTEVEHFGFATLTLIATVFGLQFFHLVDVWGFLLHHTVTALLYTVGYLAAGIGWSFIKWFSFLMGFRDKYREAKTSFYEKNNLAAGTPLPAELQEAFDLHLRGQYYYDRYRGASLGKKPRAADNKRRIIAWMAFFPFSMIGTLLNDPVKRLFKFLFETFKNLYQKMADRVFANDPELK